ncbi:MAG: hypothetical protein PWQ29_884 [Verrucomicrobiota bacterium]|nr:hypothetical protein [Verrucomicrobiota bacterium]MDK2963490.1 hypothetical protein [Verrucomicrobiota bacterium]
MNSGFKEFIRKPVTGSVLTVASGVSFFFTCMLLPLVGRAGSSVPYADKNRLAFLLAVGLTFLLAVLATGSKLMRRSDDQSPLPYWSIGVSSICILLFILLLTDLLLI